MPVTVYYFDQQLLVQNIVVDPSTDRSVYPRPTFVTANGFCVYEFDPTAAVDVTDPNGDLGNPGHGTIIQQNRDIQWNYTTGFTSNESGETYTFTHVRLRVNMFTGSKIEVYTAEMDDDVYVLKATLEGIDGLELNPKRQLTVPIGDIVAEKLSVRVKGYGMIQLNSLTLFAAKKAEDYPR